MNLSLSRNVPGSVSGCHEQDRTSSRRPRRWLNHWLSACLSLCLVSASALAAWAQESGTQAEAGAAPDNTLANGQTQLAARFKKLESLLLRSAEVEGTTNPARAKLMQEAAMLAKQVQLGEAMTRAGRSLEQRQYSQAIEDQKASLDSLNKILDLLQSENRADRVREQKDQVRRTIEETERLLRLESSLRGRTEGGGQTDKAASDQQKLAEKAAQIAKDISPEAKEDSADKPKDSAKQSEGEPSKDPANKDSSKNADKQGSENKDGSDKPNKEGDQENQDGKPDSKPKPADADAPSKDKPPADKDSPGKEPSDKKPEDKKPEDKNSGDKNSDDKNKDGKNSEDPSQSGQPKSGQPDQQPPNSQKSQPGEQQPAEGTPQESSGEPSESEDKPEQPKSPMDRAHQTLKQAQKRMEEAQQKLQEGKREGAVEKQRQAEQELKAAIEELEEILRQLREEEIERSLAALEERLRLMLQLQNKVLDESKRLQEIGAGGNDRQVEIRANNLANDEKKIINEAQRTLLLLREEGTSAAFPESLSHIISDMQKVAERLAKADVGKLTISIEEDIVSSLEELVEAMSEIKKENQDRKENPPPAGQPPQGQPGEQPLVNQLAEMRLIRTLQLRINKRTQTLSELLKDPNDVVGQAEATDIQSQLRELADRQSSIKQVTRDIVIGKNKE